MRVLVVEDEAEFANLIAEGLRDQGMAVDVAYDGLAGASSLNLNPYDVSRARPRPPRPAR